jgi:hypothetical protein
MELDIPTFLDRKQNGIVTPPVAAHKEKKIRMRSRVSIEERIASARCEAEKEAIRDREAERKAALKLVIKTGTPVHLNQRIENCPLEPGSHLVELVKKGRKWVRFRVTGRVKCVRVRRVIWDAITA